MNELVFKAHQFVTDMLVNKLPIDFTYHNFEHTKLVVEGALVIGKAENLGEEEMEVLLIAAWFHDTGLAYTKEDHEEKSVLIAMEFLQQQNASENLITKVSECIRATKQGVIPKEEVHQVIRDADMYHISKDNYDDFAKRLRIEWALVYDKFYSEKEWNHLNLQFLISHEFHTTYAKELLRDKKEQIVKRIRKKVKKIDKDIDSKLSFDLGVSSEELKTLKKKLKNAEARPEKGIETMFRLTSKNHIDISGMADSKANIMISINTIIISVLLGSLMQKLDSNPHLIPPTIILLIVTLSSIVYSVLSLRPNITSGKFNREDIENQKTNLLFFGNFHKMKREDYHWGMNRLMENASFLYSNLIDDIFFLGIVLAKKYNYLRVAYNIFMYGIIIAVIAFVTAILLFETTSI